MNFVILCGGSGSRLWPKSREKLPKQLLNLTDNFTMLENTIIRINKLIQKLEIKKYDFIKKLMIICNKEHSFIIQKQIDDLILNNVIPKITYTIINEPQGRDSAPAICISSLIGDSNDISIIMPCDHIFDDVEFINSCLKSLEFLDNSIITFGITPNKIETGYGYIKTNSNYITEKFIEKPVYEIAEQFFMNGNYLWNAGIFIFLNFTMIKCFEKYSPDILKSCIDTVNNSEINDTIINLNLEYFVKCTKISIDYAIMEKVCFDNNNENNNDNNDTNIKLFTIPYNSYWNDIGSFSSLYDQLEKNEDNNVLSGDILTHNTNNCLIESERSLVCTIGINNLIIVNTMDALLICDKNNSQDVKIMVNKLKEKNREEIILHKKVFRPWGWYLNVEGNDNSGFKVKRIAVYPKKRLSLQSHNKRSEHWVIVKGKGKVQVDDKFFELIKDDHIYIPIKALHRIENIGDELLEFTETQIGEYLGEDDIIRYEDDFGRK